jgi:hypothetical protein
MAARLVTLSGDVGAAYAAQMKAVLLRYVGAYRIVDLDLDLPAHRIAEAAFLLRHMAGDFPAGTVHLAVVDPGVGGVRAPVAVRCRDGSHLVGPDNGLLDPLARHLGVSAVVRLDPARVRSGPPVSATFEGRDLFAPAAGRIARGTSIVRLGRPWPLAALDSPGPLRRPDGASGLVVHADRFGNLVTNVPTGWAPPVGALVRVRLGGRRLFVRRQRTYEAMGSGELGLLGSSFGLLELAVREGRAADRLHAASGDPVELKWPARRQDGK